MVASYLMYSGFNFTHKPDDSGFLEVNCVEWLREPCDR